VETLLKEELHKFTPLNKYHQDEEMAWTSISHGRKGGYIQQFIQKFKRNVITWKTWEKVER
jgi:hypothetical protein